MLVIKGQDLLTVNEINYRNDEIITITWLTEQEYKIQTDKNWQIISVTYDQGTKNRKN